LLSICEKSGELYFQFNTVLWLLHLDNMGKKPTISLELALELMRGSFKDVN